jgi:cytochrome bd-type quinol oxidase subunit 2
LKRKAEKMMALIGIVLYGFLLIIGGAMVVQHDNNDFIKFIEDTAAEQQTERVDVDTLIDFIGVTGSILVIVGVVSIILGLIAITFLKENKKPNAAGTTFTVVGVLSIFCTVGLAAFPGILFIISGIMSWVRKPRPR